MPPLTTDLAEQLRAYGALPAQLIDVKRDDEPRVLSYLDLRAESPRWQLPVIVEQAGRPCVHVFDGRAGMTEDDLGSWCWRIALRGDGAWVGVLQPGRLKVFRAHVTSERVVPCQVAMAEPGEWALPKFLHDVSQGQDDVARRRYLTRLLERSARLATGYGLSQSDALSLVGRGLFWRFLIDRKLLVGLLPSDVSEKARTWQECLDSKPRALQTFRWLDQTFNGGLLPFEGRLRDFAPALFSQVLGNIAHGATPDGQLRLPTDWHEVNFAYVPVGLLSEVYEAFAHNINAKAAAEQSIHYTPAHLVDFILAQALAQLPVGGKPRVLDPAAGAGIFLVTALRKLVEREWREKGERPKRKRVRDILHKQLVGFDIDGRALRLAELALYLTALELDPSPRPLHELRFDALRGQVLFDLAPAQHGLGSLGPVEPLFRGAFDLVIGNPPWTAKAKGGAAKAAWVLHSDDIVRERLGDVRAEAFDLPDTNMDLPFVWRAMEWAKPGGRIALVTHARWLFGLSDRAAQARSDLLQAVRVTGILNGSALRLTQVWPGVDAPWCVLFASNEAPQPFDRAAFQFVSPQLDAQTASQQARLRIDWLDAQTVLAAEVIERPWTLKTRFRGNRLAARALDSMQRSGEELGKYLARIGTAFKNGYQVGGAAGKQRDATHMQGMPTTKGAAPLGFVIHAGELPRCAYQTLLFPREPAIYSPPLLLVAESIASQRLTPRSHRADTRIAFHESFHGISLAKVEQPERVARYLQLWLQSRAMVFAELLLDGRYGVERDALYQESLELLPVVPLKKLSAAEQERMWELSFRLASGLSEGLADEIDAFVFDTYALSAAEREAILDTVDTALPASEAKQRAFRPPSASERHCFVETLRDCLDSVLSASGLRTSVAEQSDIGRNPWRLLKVCVSHEGSCADAPLPIDTFLEEADAQGASLVVVRASATIWFVGLLDRYASWTRTRARLLATDLIAERSSS